MRSETFHRRLVSSFTVRTLYLTRLLKSCITKVVEYKALCMHCYTSLSEESLYSSDLLVTSLYINKSSGILQ